MKGLLRTVDTIFSWLGKILVGFLASGVILSVLLRYIFSIAFVWSEELLTMVFVATTFFGAALGLREREHIAITVFVENASRKVRNIFFVLVNVVIIFVSVFVIIYSIRMIGKVGNVPSPATGIVRGVYYAMIPISFVLTAFYAIVGVLGCFLTSAEPDNIPKKEA